MKRFSALFLLLLWLVGVSLAQEASPSPVPLGQIVPELESASQRLQELREQLEDDPVLARIQSELPVLTDEVARRRSEVSAFALSSPSLEAIRAQEEQWRTLSKPLPGWRQTLTDRANQFSQEVERLTELQKSWSQTLQQARAGQAPTTVILRIQGMIDKIFIARRQVELRRTGILALQDQVGTLDERIRESLESIQRVRSQAVDRVWQQDGAPLWSAESYRGNAGEMAANLAEAVASQWTLLGSYARTNAGSFILHLALFGALLLAFSWVRRNVHPDDPALAHSMQVFQSPVALALVISVWLSGRFYPDAPPILKAWLVAVALIPTARLLMRLIEPGLRPVLTLLVVMFFADQVRTLVAAVPVAARLVMLAQMGICLLFLYSRRTDVARHRLMWLGARAAMIAFAVSVLANLLGFVALGNLVGSATLSSMYLAMLLYALLSIADGLVLLALLVWPLNRLAVARRHQTLLRSRIHAGLRFLAGLLWVLVTLENLTVLRPLWSAGRSILAASFAVGSLRIVLGDVVAFFLILWAAALVSRFARFVLEEDVYPRLRLSPGVPYAMSAVLHYTVLLVGFLLAMSALGVDTGRFTVLAGAFGVGIGFGLQNIVNNFVSGLILLFERPIKVGDVIKLEDVTGTLTRIGLRASVVRIWDGSDVIVPNGDMISNRVVNWTLARQSTRVIDIQLGVAYDSDPAAVLALLEKTAAEHPGVLQTPAPEAQLLEFGDNALQLQLRAHTRERSWSKVRSEVMVALSRALAEAGVEVPYPQRTLHLDVKQVRKLAELPRGGRPEPAG